MQPFHQAYPRRIPEVTAGRIDRIVEVEPEDTETYTEIY